jgi:hypothetical protein
MIWAYRTTSKKLIGHTPFILVYGQETIMPLEFIIPSLHIVALTELTDSSVVEKRISVLVEIEEDYFVAEFHQHVQKACEKAWHDKHIKHKKFQMGDLVFLYDSKFLQHPESSKCTGWVHM